MIGQRLKQARLNLGLKQSALGAIVGVSASFISQCESGRKFPRLDVFLKIVDALNVSPNYVLGREVSVAARDTEYTVFLSMKDLEILEKIREYKSLYTVLSSDRTSDIISSWAHKF